MIKKICFCCLLVLLWGLSLAPARGFSQDDRRGRWSGPADLSSDSVVAGRTSHPDTIRCWEVSGRMPHYNEQGEVDSFVTMSRRLYTNGPLMMYVYDGHLYYLFHKDSVAGIYWDIRHQDLTSSFRVDSLQRMATPYLTHFGLFKKGFGRLISTAIDARTGLLKETYCDINFRKHPNADSCYVTYTDRFNFLPRDMSLSYSLDSLYGKRLCGVTFVMRTAGAAVPRSAGAPTSAASAAVARMAAVAASSAAAEPGSGMGRRAEWSWKLEEIRDFDRATIQSDFSR